MTRARPVRSGWRDGLKVGVGFAASSFALAVTFGAQARAAGWDVWQSGAFSTFAFSGSAQFGALTALAGGGGVVAAVTSAALLNTRYLPMGAAVAGSLRGGRLRRAVEGQAVVDGSWVASYRGDGRYDRGVLIGATVVQWPAWIGGTVLGSAVDLTAADLHRFGLDLVFPGYFLLLLCERTSSSRSSRPVALVAAALAAAALLALPPGLALWLSAAAALLVLVGRRRA